MAVSESIRERTVNEIARVDHAELMQEKCEPSSDPVIVYLASLKSANSRRAMAHSLRVIAEIVAPDAQPNAVPWHALRYQHCQAIRSRLAEAHSPATANRHLAALRGVLKECWRLGLMNAEDYHRAVDFKRINGGSTVSQAEKGRHLSSGELNALIAACDDGTKAGARDAAIIALAYLGGLRRSELASLQLSDWNPSECNLMIRGKGDKKRIIPIGDGAHDALLDWLTVRGGWAGALFVRVRKGDNVGDEGLTGQAIYTIMASRAQQANVKEFAPHDLRRTFAGDLLDAGADIATVQQLMGHAKVDTTAKYDRRGARAKRDAIGKLHIGYRRNNT